MADSACREAVAAVWRIESARIVGALARYAGDFADDESWRDAVVDAGNASGDLAWPWPLHPRYRPLIDSTVADLRNTAGKGFGFPIVAATFLQQFAGDGPWAHRGATGYGVRMLVELAARLAGLHA